MPLSAQQLENIEFPSCFEVWVLLYFHKPTFIETGVFAELTCSKVNNEPYS